MEKISVKVKRLPHFRGELPRYESLYASGVDVRACLENPITLVPGQRVLIPTGLAFAIPPGYEIQVRPRSGWATKKGIGVPNSPGTVDSDYRGEVKIALINLGEEAVEILDQDRVAQLVLAPVLQAVWEEAAVLEATERGAGGFGSTGLGTQATPGNS